MPLLTDDPRCGLGKYGVIPRLLAGLDVLDLEVAAIGDDIDRLNLDRSAISGSRRSAPVPSAAPRIASASRAAPRSFPRGFWCASRLSRLPRHRSRRGAADIRPDACPPP